MSQALVHFQSDESWASQRAQAQAAFLMSAQDAEREQLGERLARLMEGKRKRLEAKLQAKAMRNEEKVRIRRVRGKEERG